MSFSLLLSLKWCWAGAGFLHGRISTYFKVLFNASFCSFWSRNTLTEFPKGITVLSFSWLELGIKVNFSYSVWEPEPF